MIGIDITAVRTAAEGAEFRPGTLFRLDDNDDAQVYGTREFLYVEAGEAITGEGYLCVVGSDSVASMVDTTSAAPGAGFGMRCGAALAAIASGGYGWVQVYGRGPLRVNANAAAGTRLNVTATGGQLDDNGGSGAEQIGGVSLGTAQGGSAGVNDDAYFNYPFVMLTL